MPPDDKLLHAPPDLDLFDVALPRLDDALAGRIDTDPKDPARGLGQLVLTIVELLRQLMERQALRRVDEGTLTEEETERLGAAFLALDECMAELLDTFGLTAEDLNLDLGPLGRLLD
jgi:Gas vesicle protein K